MERRDFLINSLGLGGLLFLKPSFAAKKSSPPLIHSHTRFVTGDGEAKTIKKDYYFLSEPITSYLTVTSANGDFFSMDVPTKAHEVTPHPLNKDIVLGTSKWGKEAYVANIKDKTVLAAIKGTDNFVFNGHSVYSSDGQFIYMTMMDFDHYRGGISVRETKTYKEVKRLPTYGVFPHQLKWYTPDKVYAVVNAMPENTKAFQCSLFNLVDLQTNQLIKSYPVKETKNAHFTFTHDQKSAFIARSISPNNFRFYQMLNLEDGSIISPEKWTPRKEEIAECLSHILIEEKNLVAMTLYGVNEIIIWNYKTNEIHSTFPTADSPRGIGISADRKTIYITFRNKTESYIALYHFDTFFKQPLSHYAQLKGGNGSHLTLI